MHRGPSILSFLLVLATYVGLHSYMWARLIRSTELPTRWRRGATACLVTMGVYMPASFMLGRLDGAGWPAALIWPAVLWTGLALYLVLALIVTDLLRWLAELWLWRRRPERFKQAATKRRLYRVFAAAAVGLATVATAVGVTTVACGPAVVRVEVPLDELSASQDGLTLVQLSDLHIGRTIGRRYVENVVSEVNALRPDVVVITGDLVDGKVAELEDAVAPLFGLQARHGVYFVTGNHDHYSGAAPWRAHLSAGGIRVLSNASTRIGDGPASFDLAGIEDRRGHANLLGALAECSPSTPTVLLAHRPEMVFEAAPAGVDLQLSGHTHGGQLWPFTFVVNQAAPYARGLHHHADTWLYVNVGTGYVGPPLRLGTRSEITVVTLRAPQPR